jgi:hypothetical protein
MQSHRTIATLTGEFEIQVDRGFHFHGFAIQKEWAVELSLTHSTNGLDQYPRRQGISAHRHYVPHSPLEQWP